MTGFNFRDLIQPGMGAELAFRRELERRREAWDLEGYAYRGGADLLLRHGWFTTGRPMPDPYRQLCGVAGRCFPNALAAVHAEPGLRYVEGYYTLGHGHFKPHAWCIDADDQIVDVTATEDWVGQLDYHRIPIPPQDHWAYWGAVFHIELVQEHQDALGLGMLDRPGADMEDHGRMSSIGVLDLANFHDFPILKVTYDPDRRTLGL